MRQPENEQKTRMSAFLSSVRSRGADGRGGRRGGANQSKVSSTLPETQPVEHYSNVSTCPAYLVLPAEWQQQVEKQRRSPLKKSKNEQDSAWRPVRRQRGRWRRLRRAPAEGRLDGHPRRKRRARPNQTRAPRLASARRAGELNKGAKTGEEGGPWWLAAV